MTTFIPGLELSQYFFSELIQPLMMQAFPGLRYSAARLDYGSDVLGFDTPMSMDHGWGPKMTLFLTEADFDHYHDILNDYFAYHLPFECHGFPTHFGEPLADGGVMSHKETHPIHHGIIITTPKKFILEYLGVDIHKSLTPAIWLTIPQQRLRSLQAGRLFYDGLEKLSYLRKQFQWYPHDLWLYLMASQWQRISQDEPFVGRTGSVGDQIGVRLIAARVIHNLMSLGFLMEMQYAPYHKWFGSAFQQLRIAPELTPVINDVLNSTKWQNIETHLLKAYMIMAKAHNSLGITPANKATISPFYSRPFLVPNSSRFVKALMSQIKEPSVQELPRHLGSLDQIVDNTDLKENLSHCQLLRILYKDSTDN